MRHKLHIIPSEMESTLQTGIENLLKNIQSRSVELSSLKGCSFAIDGHVLLHSVGFQCAEAFVRKGDCDLLARGIAMTVKQFLQVARHVILVFDGGFLPSKAATNVAR